MFQMPFYASSLEETEGAFFGLGLSVHLCMCLCFKLAFSQEPLEIGIGNFICGISMWIKHMLGA